LEGKFLKVPKGRGGVLVEELTFPQKTTLNSGPTMSFKEYLSLGNEPRVFDDLFRERWVSFGRRVKKIGSRRNSHFFPKNQKILPLPVHQNKSPSIPPYSITPPSSTTSIITTATTSKNTVEALTTLIPRTLSQFQ
jgi:hypothetical protein